MTSSNNGDFTCKHLPNRETNEVDKLSRCTHEQVCVCIDRYWMICVCAYMHTCITCIIIHALHASMHPCIHAFIHPSINPSIYIYRYSRTVYCVQYSIYSVVYIYIHMDIYIYIIYMFPHIFLLAFIYSILFNILLIQSLSFQAHQSLSARPWAAEVRWTLLCLGATLGPLPVGDWGDLWVENPWDSFVICFMGLHGCTRPGKPTVCYWTWPFIVDFPKQNGDFP